MKKLGLVLGAMLVLAGAAYAQSTDPTAVDFDLYNDWNMVSAPQVPFNPFPSSPAMYGGDQTGVFDPIDVDGAGSLSRWDATTQSQVLWGYFAASTFGNVLLGDGYWLYSPTGGHVHYKGVPDGVPDATGAMTDMWISLPGSQEDGVDAGGWHMIGTPFNHHVCFSKVPGQFPGAGDNILVTNGSEVKTWADAVAARWVDEPMTGWDGAAQGQISVGYFFANTEYLEPGQSYWVHTNVDNLALIIPAN